MALCEPAPVDPRTGVKDGAPLLVRASQADAEMSQLQGRYQWWSCSGVAM